MSVSPPIDDPSGADEHIRDRPINSPRALVIVIGGIGSLDWCGLALRRLLGNKRPPYTTRIFTWGLGFGRWHADLTNVANRDANARALAEAIRLSKAGQPACPVFMVAKSGGSGIAVKVPRITGRTFRRASRASGPRAVSGLRPHHSPPRGSPGDRGLLVAFGCHYPRCRYSHVRHDRPRKNRRRGLGWLSNSSRQSCRPRSTSRIP